MKAVTNVTNTYYESYYLHECYDNLVSQTNKDFIWLNDDDGSTDETKDLVSKWMNEGKIDIEYVWQENQGIHGAHNMAYECMQTELNVCIDSDDYMPVDAVEKILDF